MTLAFPRTLPSSRILGCYFEPEPQESFAPEQGGRFVSTELGPTMWSLKISTTPPTEAEYDLWRAFFASLKGSGKLFYGRDVRRGPYPITYRRGFGELIRAVSGGAFDGTSTTWSVNGARDEITIGAASGQELPIGFKLTFGDYIGLKWATSKRSLHRVLEDVNTNGSGVGTWTVEPPVHPDVPSNASINLVRADCLMVITKRDADAEHLNRRVSFEAKQHLEF